MALQTIGAIHIPIYPTEYQLVWGPSPSGKFSINSAKRLQITHSSSSLDSYLARLWKIKLSPKINLFFLGCFHNLDIMLGNDSHFLPISNLFPFCNLSPGSFTHVYSYQLWKHLNYK